YSADHRRSRADSSANEAFLSRQWEEQRNPFPLNHQYYRRSITFRRRILVLPATRSLRSEKSILALQSCISINLR
ncbi:hypothetical protein A2U01_0093202, partial [Trifolium medium]|nr:hypothetical protein [Trifolium medium]